MLKNLQENKKELKKSSKKRIDYGFDAIGTTTLIQSLIKNNNLIAPNESGGYVNNELSGLNQVDVLLAKHFVDEKSNSTISSD